MAKQKATSAVVTLALTPEQKAEATTFFQENAQSHERGAPRWAKIRAMFVLAGVESKELKAELATLNRKIWLERAQTVKGSPLTVEEIDKCRKTANADFSRGVRDPNAKKKATANSAKTSAQTASTASQADGTEKQVPHAVLMQAQLEKLSTRAKSLSAGVLNFQNSVRIPKAGIPLIGDIAESLAKMHEEIGAAIALLS